MQLLLVRTPLLMVVRTDALALGVLLAMWSVQPSYQRFQPTFLRRPWVGTSALIVIGLLMSYLATDPFSASHYRIGAIAILSALLVWIASYNRDYLLPAGRLQRLMAWVGSRSYGIYMIHIPAYFLVREVIFRLQAAGLPSPAGHPIVTLLFAFGLIVLLSVGGFTAGTFVNNRLVARGEVVVVEDRLGVTMTEIIKTEDTGA